jgi:chitosanase
MRELDEKIIKFASAIETGNIKVRYADVYIYGDGANRRRQVTLSYGFTEDQGNLLRLLKVYDATEGVYSLQFEKFLPLIGTGVLHESVEFIELLKKAAKSDNHFCDCQDFVFDALYVERAKRKAIEYGIFTELGLMIVTDSILQGSFDKVANKFPEKRPSKGGDEKVFLKAYLVARKKWLLGCGGNLANSVYRVNDLLAAVEAGNWDLSQPILANDILIS